MSSDINRVIITGRLGADPEVRVTQTGTPVLNLRIASTRKWFDKTTNAEKEDTAWMSAVCFGKRAEALSKILQKGERVMIEGSLRTSSYDDKDGVKRNRVEIAIDEIVFSGGSRRDDAPAQSSVPGTSGERRQQHGQQRGGGGSGGGSARTGAPAATSQADDWGGGGGSDDDVPFMSSAMAHDLRRVGM
jgi:single-strand DNA-binding protein